MPGAAVQQSKMKKKKKEAPPLLPARERKQFYPQFPAFSLAFSFCFRSFKSLGESTTNSSLQQDLNPSSSGDWWVLNPLRHTDFLNRRLSYFALVKNDQEGTMRPQKGLPFSFSLIAIPAHLAWLLNGIEIKSGLAITGFGLCPSFLTCLEAPRNKSRYYI